MNRDDQQNELLTRVDAAAHELMQKLQCDFEMSTHHDSVMFDLFYPEEGDLETIEQEAAKVAAEINHPAVRSYRDGNTVVIEFNWLLV